VDHDLEQPARELDTHRAVVSGRAAARRLQVEHTIHPGDGQISEKNSYGSDPYPPRDGR